MSATMLAYSLPLLGKTTQHKFEINVFPSPVYTVLSRGCFISRMARRRKDNCRSLVCGYKVFYVLKLSVGCSYNMVTVFYTSVTRITGLTR